MITRIPLILLLPFKYVLLLFNKISYFMEVVFRRSQTQIRINSGISKHFVHIHKVFKFEEEKKQKLHLSQSYKNEDGHKFINKSDQNKIIGNLKMKAKWCEITISFLIYFEAIINGNIELHLTLLRFLGLIFNISIQCLRPYPSKSKSKGA